MGVSIGWLAVRGKDADTVLRALADAENTRAEAAENGRLAKLVGDLLIGVADEPDKNLLGEKLRRAPVQMPIDAALVIRGRVRKVIGQSRDDRKLVSGCRIEVGVSTTGIDRAMSKAEVGQTCRAIIANGNISGEVGHEIVDSEIPFQRRLRIKVAEPRCGIVDTAASHRAQRRQRGCNGSVDAGTGSSADCPQLHRQLATKNLRGESIARNHQGEVRAGVQACIEADV